MAQYTEDFLAAARHGYENTDQPMRELARELGIGITTLSTLAEKNGWAKRSQRKRGVPPAMQLLAEAQALAASTLPPRSGGEGRLASADASPGGGHFSVEVEEPPTPDPSPPFAEPVIGPAQEGRTRWFAEGGEQQANRAPTLLDRMEQILEQIIAGEEAAPANGIRSPQSARNLATLIQAMRALKGMRGHASPDTGPSENHDDDMPRDIDEFRHALARRIEALFASRADSGDADANSERANVDAG